MAGSVPWSVNAVDPEAWADARDAARRSGQSVGEWLEAAIRNAANDRHPPRAQAPQNFDPIERRLDDIADRIEHFSRQTRESPRAARTDTAVIASIDALNHRIDSLSRDMRSGERSGPAEIRTAIQKLEDRIEHLLSRGRIAEAGVPQDLERKLESISRAIEAMSHRLAQESTAYDPEPLPSTVDELDNAVAEIMMRQAVLDGTPLPRTMPRPGPRARAERAREEPRERAPAAPQPDFSGLERQLKAMADEMQAMRQSHGRDDSIAALRAEIRDLSAKLGELAPRRSIESIERAIESLAMRIDRTGGARPDEAITEVVDALHDIRSALADVRPAESFVSVENDLQALSHKLDTLGARGIDGGAVARLQEQTAEIRDLLSGALPSDVLKALVEQIEVLVARFEERRQEPDTALLDLMEAFDRRIETLSERIDAANRQTPQAPALDDIRERLDQLQEAVSRSGGNAGSDRVEATLRALAGKVDAAEARLGNLSAIERGLSDLFAQIEEARTGAEEATERAVKSAVREMTASQPVQAPFEPQRRTPAELEIKYSSASRRAEPAIEAAAESTRREMPRMDLRAVPQARPAQNEGAEIEPDYPLEPGSGAPRVRLQSAALRVAQSEAAIAGISATMPESGGKTSDFIAAARRAAQAANAEPTAEPAEPAAGGVRNRIVSLLGRSRRALLIGLTLFLLIVAAFRYFDGQLPLPFGSTTPASAPVTISPKASAPVTAIPVTPAVKDARAPVENEAAAVPVAAADPMASVPPAGILGAGKDMHFSGEGAAAPETTGSTSARRAAAPVQTASAPATSAASAETAGPGDAIPAALGTAALRMAAVAGDPMAAYEIGARYLDGRGVRADAAEAAKWLERAHAKGSIPAAYRLGSIHEKGMNGKKNTAEALRYYRIAAEGGNIKAMHNLAVVHAEGGEGEADLRAAARWFRMAADRGVRDSQYNLGVLYARGLGVDQNFAESYRWFAIAANQGDTDAAKKRDDVAKRLDVQTLVATKLAVQTWVPAKTEPRANEVQLKPEWESADAAARKRSVKK